MGGKILSIICTMTSQKITHVLDTHLSAIQCILTRPPHCEKAVQSKQTQIKLRRTGENGLVWSPSLWLHTRELGRGNRRVSAGKSCHGHGI